MHDIPRPLIRHLLSSVSVRKMTIKTRNSTTLPTKDATDKGNITLTFDISLNGDFLPMQIICLGKTKASQPRVFEFPRRFAEAQNPKHHSNELETVKLID